MNTLIDENTNCTQQLKKGIYCLLNNITKEFYIGSVSSKGYFRRRWQKHMIDLLHNKHCNQHLQNSFNKYGKNNFQFLILETLEDDELILEREQYYIDNTNCLTVGYNKYPLAISINKDYIASKEARAKISNKLLGRKRPQWLCEKLGKIVHQYSKEGELIAEYVSVMEASRVLNIHNSNIKNAIKGRKGMKSYKGFIWKYK